MLRQTRIEFPGAFYHNRVRCNRREPIFLSGDDHLLFLKTLGKPAAKHGWNIHVSPLMPDHQHLAAVNPRAQLDPCDDPVAVYLHRSSDRRPIHRPTKID